MPLVHIVLLDSVSRITQITSPILLCNLIRTWTCSHATSPFFADHLYLDSSQHLPEHIAHLACLNIRFTSPLGCYNLLSWPLEPKLCVLPSALLLIRSGHSCCSALSKVTHTVRQVFTTALSCQGSDEAERVSSVGPHQRDYWWNTIPTSPQQLCRLL